MAGGCAGGCSVLLPLLLALLTSPFLCASQSCESFQSDLLPSCGFVFDGDAVFVPAGETQSTLLAKSTIAGSLSLLAQASANCSSAALALLCPTIWGHCLDLRTIASPLNRSLCRNVCEEVYTACAAEIKSFGLSTSSLLPNCTALDPQGAYVYPVDGYNITVDGNETTVTCWASLGGSPNSTNVVCPEPLVRRNNGLCLLPCPSTLISPRRFKSLKIVLSIFSVLSMLGWIILFASQALRHGWKCLRWPLCIPVI